MAITPAPGYIIDPNNPNAVIVDPKAQIGPGGVPIVPTTATVLPTTTAPTSTSNITTGITAPQTPTVKYPTGSISSATAATAGADSYYNTLSLQQQQLAADAKAQMEALQKQSTEQAAPFLSKLLGAKSPEQVRSETQLQTGINPTEYFADEKSRIAEIGTLSTEYNNLVAARDQQIASLTGQGRGIPIDFLNNQAAQIEKNAAPRLNALSANINAKTAVMQAMRGLFQEAQTYVNQAVEDATANTRFNLDMYKTFYDLNKDSIDKLDDKYKTALSNSIDAATAAHTENVANKTLIGKLMIDNPQAGITMTDTLEQAYTKAGLKPGTSLDDKYKQAQIDNIRSEIANRGKDGGSNATTGFGSSKVESDVRGDAVSLLDEVKAGTMTLDEAYKKLRTLYSTYEVSDAALKTLLGISTTTSNTSSTSFGTSTPIKSSPVYSGFGGSTPSYYSSTPTNSLTDSLYSFLFK